MLTRDEKNKTDKVAQSRRVGTISESLEDYLETIFELIEEREVARVKDIAERRDVRMSSVTDALRRLKKQGLVNYRAREVVEFTPAGAELARKVIQRHEFLKRFLTDILQVDPATAEEDACAIEHHISSKTLGRLAACYQFLSTCPRVTEDILQEMRNCCTGDFRSSDPPAVVRARPLVEDGWESAAPAGPATQPVFRLSELLPGERGRVVGLRAQSSIRLRLVEMGVLPNVFVEMEGKAPLGDPIRIKLRGYRLSLRGEEADSIMVVREAA